jgi:hypothetical protein
VFTLRTASEFVEWGAMKSKLLRSVVAMLLASVIAHAQDSRFPPTGQQIPVPECVGGKIFGRVASNSAARPNTNRDWPTSAIGGMNAVSAQGMTVPATTFRRSSGRNPVSFSLR